MSEKIVFSQKYGLCDNDIIYHVTMPARTKLVLNLNELFDLNKFKMAIINASKSLDVKMEMVESEPTIIKKTNCYFIYNKRDSQLIFLCSHKYFDGSLVSYVFKIIDSHYSKITDEDLIKNNQIIPKEENNTVSDLVGFVKDVTSKDSTNILKTVINVLTDHNVLVGDRIHHLSRNEDLQNNPRCLFNYNPKNFNTIHFIESIQNTTNATILLLMESRNAKGLPPNVFGNFLSILVIAPADNVREKIKTFNLAAVDNNVNLFTSVSSAVLSGGKIAFINSLKNAYLASFIDSLVLMGSADNFLQTAINFDNYNIMPTDKNGNTFVVKRDGKE